MKYLIIWKDKNKQPYDFRTGGYARDFAIRNRDFIEKVICYYAMWKKVDYEKIISTTLYKEYLIDEFLITEKIELEEHEEPITINLKKDCLNGEVINNSISSVSIYAYIGKWCKIKMVDGNNYTGWLQKSKAHPSKLILLMNDGKTTDQFSVFAVEKISLANE